MKESNLGPLLFLIFFNDIFLHEEVECFADDSTLSSSKNVPSEIERCLSLDCQYFSQWMSENKFKLNVDKTKFLLAGTAKRLQRVQKISVKYKE